MDFHFQGQITPTTSLGHCSNALTCPCSCCSGFQSSLPVVYSLHSGSPRHFLKVPGGYFCCLPTLLQFLGTVTHFLILPSHHHLLQAWPNLKDIALAWPRTFSSHSLVAGSSCSSPAVVYLSTLSCAASQLSNSTLTPALIPPSSCPLCLHLFTIVVFFFMI